MYDCFSDFSSAAAVLIINVNHETGRHRLLENMQCVVLRAESFGNPGKAEERDVSLRDFL